jgi:hypothetical protein
MIMRPLARVLTVAIALVLGAALAPAALGKDVEPRFDPADPAGSPFPSDLFTVPDGSQLTGLRVSLPKLDCSVRRSDCEDVDVLNTLDGFNLQPRLTVPFTGPIDPASVTSQTVFLLEQGPDARLVGINQIVWDPEASTLHVESDELLAQHARYLLVVTDGVRDASGDRIGSAPFRKVLNFGQTMDTAEKAYRISLLQALDMLEAAGVPPGRVAAASIFTTQSATAVLAKIRDQVQAEMPAPADFLLGLSGERTVFSLADVSSVTTRRQVGTAPTFTTNTASLSLLQIVPGAVGTVASGKYVSPNYLTGGEFLPPIGTRTGTPTVRRMDEVYFNLVLPSGLEPSAGWPVAIFGHGSTSNKESVIVVAAKLAEQGIATIAINAVGHGGGPLSMLTFDLASGEQVTFPAGGRGIDQNGDSVIGVDEGFTPAPGTGRAVLLSRDGISQTVVDLMQLVRVIRGGMDADGDGAPDLDSNRISYLGLSLGGIYGTDFVALEPGVRAAVETVTGGPLVDVLRLQRGGGRAVLGRFLAERTPLLVNGGPDPISPTNPFPFREDLPLRNEPPVADPLRGAIAIQEVLERIEWAMQPSSPVAYAPLLRKSPFAGVPARPVLFAFAKGDQTVANPTTTAILRAGDLGDRTLYFRNDLAYATTPAIGKNPHLFLVNFSPTGIGPALAAQEAVATFLASDGQVTLDPDGAGPLFETPIVGPLPEDLQFIP